MFGGQCVFQRYDLDAGFNGGFAQITVFRIQIADNPAAAMHVEKCRLRAGTGMRCVAAYAAWSGGARYFHRFDVRRLRAARVPRCKKGRGICADRGDGHGAVAAAFPPGCHAGENGPAFRIEKGNRIDGFVHRDWLRAISGGCGF